MPHSDLLRITPGEHQSLWLTLTRPDVHNAFNDALIAELTDAIQAAGNDPDVRSIVLAGEGKSFSAGADLNWMRQMASYTEAENIADARQLYGLIHTLRHCPKPTIARVHGSAFGGGLGLIAACDMAATLPTALFALTEVKLGLVPAVISPVVVERIGSAARRLFVTAERFDGIEAQRIGLVDAVVDDEAALEHWIALRTKLIAANGPEATTAAKQLATDVINHVYDDPETSLATLIAQRRISNEGQTRMTAFLDKL